MTKSLLILAMDHDLHADAVHDLITQKGYSSFRLDPEADWAFAHRPKEDRHWFPSAEMQWHLNLDSDGSSSLKWYDQTIDLTNIGAVFCRNFQFARANAEAPIETHLKFSEMRSGRDHTCSNFALVLRAAIMRVLWAAGHLTAKALNDTVFE